MRNPVTIPLTKDKTRILIISEDNLIGIIDDLSGKSLISINVNGQLLQESSESTASELYEEICSPSK